MSISPLTPAVVNSNIMKFIADSEVNSKAKYSRPEKFDPNSENYDSWYQVAIPQMNMTVGRINIDQAIRGVLKCEIYARTQDKQYAHLELASEIQTALCNEGFQVLNYGVMGSPVAGWCSIYEPNIQDRGKSGVYQLAVLTARFKVERTV